jgi:hypothetical protein
VLQLLFGAIAILLSVLPASRAGDPSRRARLIERSFGRIKVPLPALRRFAPVTPPPTWACKS